MHVTRRATYSTLQIQGIKRFACQTRLLQTQNACKRCAKRVYYKRKTRVNAALNACKRSAKRVYYKRKTRLLHAKRVCWKRVLRDHVPIETARGPRVWLTRGTSTCANFVGGTRCDRSYIRVYRRYDSRPRVEQASGRINLPAR